MTGTGERGVTAVELLIALFLLGIAFLGLAAAFPYAMYGVTAGGYQTSATLLAQQSVDRAQNTDWSGLCAMVASETQDPVTDHPGYRRTFSISPACSGGTPGGGSATLATITVVVEFSGVIPNPIYQTTLVTQVTD
jgi:hypothetical protein